MSLHRTMELVLRVKYETPEGDVQPEAADCEEAIRGAVVHATNRGLLSGDHLVVDDYRYTVNDVTEP